ncbi:hypothetical protein VTK26DRAFT_7975 [Humicola hyalothermophila]
MAPTAPAKTTSSGSGGGKRLTARQKARMRLADPLLPRKLHREDNVVTDSFINSKRDKRLIKHSAFVSRITSSASGGISKQRQQKTKRRRPSKKLVATLESLGDALEDIQAEMDAEEGGEWEGIDEQQKGKIRHKSLRTRPGALKRKEKLVKGEMQRFGASLAQLTSIAAAAGAAAPAGGMGTGAGTGADQGGAAASTEMDADMEGGKQGSSAESQTQTTGAAASATSSRWAALRGFISATMEQNPAFLNKT